MRCDACTSHVAHSCTQKKKGPNRDPQAPARSALGACHTALNAALKIDGSLPRLLEDPLELGDLGTLVAELTEQLEAALVETLVAQHQRLDQLLEIAIVHVLEVCCHGNEQKATRFRDAMRKPCAFEAEAVASSCSARCRSA